MSVTQTLFARSTRRTFHGLLLSVAVIAAWATLPATAADATGQFVDLIYTDAVGDHKYVVFVPAGYSPEKKWPAILYLHGAGERGTDGRKPVSVGIGPFVRQQAQSFPALVVFPQCEDLQGRILTGWSADSADGRRAIEIFKAVEAKYNVDERHRVLTGWSMGGYGAWNIAAAMPEYWSAVVPVSGGGDVATAAKLAQQPVWAFHGSDDTVVRPEETRNMVQAVTAAGGHPRYSEVSGAGHDVWKYVYASDALHRWMLDPQSASSAPTALRATPGERPLLQGNEQDPFVPAVEIHDAVFVRMGNDMLKTLADAVPQNIRADMLSGGIADIHDSTVAEGYFFNVQLTQIGYSGSVERAVVRAYRKDRLNVQLGLRNVNLHIGRTFVTGKRHSAVAGPISIVIGHQRPVWLSLALEPYVENRKLRFRHVGTWFEIPDDNWYVTGPAGVSTRGFGMTRKAVSGGLIRGIYGKKNRIEQEISAVVPKILQQVEANLDRRELNDIVSSFWPLPVYRPRVRVWPQAVSTDENGVSLSMGVTAAAVDPSRAPATPRVVAASAVPVADRPQGTSLRVALSPSMLEPLTQLLIDANVARIHLSDIPEKRFALLGDRNALADAIPELSRLSPSTEIWAELILSNPISIVDSPRSDSTTPNGEDRAPAVTAKPVVAVEGTTESPPGAGEPAADDGDAPSVGAPNAPGAQHALRIAAPGVLIALATRPETGQGNWTPFAEFNFNVGQEAQATVEHPSYQQRELCFDWIGQPAIDCSARFAPDYRAENPEIHVDKIRQVFLDAWQGWTNEGSLAKTTINDVDFGLTKLRLKSVEWNGEDIALDFSNPGVKLTNKSDVDLVYETKGVYSGWGGPYTLAPGKSHEYEVAAALTYRRNSKGGVSVYTLPAGSQFEFRSLAAGQEPSLFRSRIAPATRTPEKKTPAPTP